VKKRLDPIVGLVLVLAACALAIGLVFGRPNVSLALVEYKRWPHGAILRLTNGTKSTIRYLADDNDTSARSFAFSKHRAVGTVQHGWDYCDLPTRQTDEKVATLRRLHQAILQHQDNTPRTS